VLAIAGHGAAMGCHEALFTLGEAPEDRYPVAGEWLEAHGHAVSVEYDGSGGFARAQRERPEVMLLDIGLPDMDGHALARRLRASSDTAGAVRIALTG